MKIIVFGLGSIGTRHARILLKNFKHEVYAFRSRRPEKLNALGLKEIYNWEDVKRLRPEVAFITNPTFLHVTTALRCASLGMHLFIEKPLSHNRDDLTRLESLCQKENRVGYVAYCLRFNPVIKKIRSLIVGKEIYHARVTCSSYLPHWRKGADYRQSYSVSKEQGGGVILDLSHEFDYIQYLFGDIASIEGSCGRVSDLTKDAEDFADVLIKTRSQVPINCHLNFMSRLDERRIVVDFRDGYIHADLLRGRIIYFYKNKTKKFSLPLEDDSLFTAQLRYFLGNLDNPLLMNNLREAGVLLTRVIAFKEKKERKFSRTKDARNNKLQEKILVGR